MPRSVTRLAAGVVAIVAAYMVADVLGTVGTGFTPALTETVLVVLFYVPVTSAALWGWWSAVVWCVCGRRLEEVIWEATT